MLNLNPNPIWYGSPWRNSKGYMAKISDHGSSRWKDTAGYEWNCSQKGNWWHGKWSSKKGKCLKSGSIFIIVDQRHQSQNLLRTTMLMNHYPAKVSPHKYVNSTKCVIQSRELNNMEESEIAKELRSQGFLAVKRISVRYDLYALTINGQTIPEHIDIGYLKAPTRLYIPNPQRCFQCQKFGHTKNSYKGKAVCAGCGKEGHTLDDCTNEPKCVNCEENIMQRQEIVQNGNWKRK